MLGPAPPPSSPQQCFSLPSLHAWNKSCLGPPPPSSDFYSFFCGMGPPPTSRPTLHPRLSSGSQVDISFSAVLSVPLLSGRAWASLPSPGVPDRPPLFPKKGPYVGVSESVRGSRFSLRGKEERACRSTKHRLRISSAYILARRHVDAFFFASSFFGGATFCSVLRISTSASAASTWRYSRSMYALVFGDLGWKEPGLGSMRLSSRLPQRTAPMSISSRCLATDSVGSQTTTFLGQMRVRPAGSVWGGGASYTTGTAQLWTCWLDGAVSWREQVYTKVYTHALAPWWAGWSSSASLPHALWAGGSSSASLSHALASWWAGVPSSASLPSRIFAFLYVCFALSSPVPKSWISNQVSMHRSHSIPPISQTATCMPLPYTSCSSPL